MGVEKLWRFGAGSEELCRSSDGKLLCKIGTLGIVVKERGISQQGGADS